MGKKKVEAKIDPPIQSSPKVEIIKEDLQIHSINIIPAENAVDQNTVGTLKIIQQYDTEAIAREMRALPFDSFAVDTLIENFMRDNEGAKEDEVRALVLQAIEKNLIEVCAATTSRDAQGNEIEVPVRVRLISCE